jgi:FkbM family methyltransferase
MINRLFFIFNKLLSLLVAYLMKKSLSINRIIALKLYRFFSKIPTITILPKKTIIIYPLIETKLYDIVKEVWIQEIYGGKELFENSCVIDVGAHVGVFTLFALRNGAKYVIAIEPNPQAVKYLIRNVYVNKVSSKVKVLPYAIGSERSKAKLYLHALSMGDSSFEKKWHGKDIMEAIECQIIKLDDIITMIPDQCLRIALKVDVEGSEIEVLRSGLTLLQKVTFLALEIHGSLKDLKERLKLITYLLLRLGFRISSFKLLYTDTCIVMYRRV